MSVDFFNWVNMRYIFVLQLHGLELSKVYLLNPLTFQVGIRNPGVCLTSGWRKGLSI